MNRVEFRVRVEPKEREARSAGLLELRQKLVLNQERSFLGQNTPLSIAGVIALIDRMLAGQ